MVPLPRLKPSDIKYLSLEGGGGKGNALIGALQALADPKIKVLQYKNYRLKGQIKGVSGASAGAITALFLSCGYTPEEIQIITEIENFDNFFDKPTAGFVPAVGGFRENTKTIDPDIELFNLIELLLDNLFKDVNSVKDLVDITSKIVINFVAIYPTVNKIINLNLYAVILATLFLFIKDKLPEAAYKKITENSKRASLSIFYDFGIFPGAKVEDFFKRWIAIARWRIKNPSKYEDFLKAHGDKALEHMRYNSMTQGAPNYDSLKKLETVTFETHKKEFGVKFAVTGTNLETFKSHIFSSSTTPKFDVADAVRISMSLPLVYKPFIITKEDLKEIIGPKEKVRYKNDLTGQGEDHYLKGLWVDGGLFNNLPLHVFDNEDGENPKTLGLRLEYDSRTEIESIFDLLKVWPGKFFAGTGEAHLSKTRNNYEQSIILDTEPLDIFSFNPGSSVAKKVTERSKATTLRYFGIKNMKN